MTDRGLPPGWAHARLADLGVWAGGGTPSKAEPAFWSAGTVPWLSPKDMSGRTLTVTQDKVSAIVLERTNIKLVPGPSVAVVVRSGILERKVPVALVPFDTTLNQDMKALVPGAGVSASWLRYALLAGESRIMRDCRKAGTTVASIETSRLFALEFAIPPSNEQTRIAQELDAQFSLLDGAERSIDESLSRFAALEASLRRAAVRGEMCASPESGLSRDDVLAIRAEEAAGSPSVAPVDSPTWCPSNWSVMSLSDLSWDLDYGTSTRCDYDGAGLPVLRIPNVVDGCIDRTSLKRAVDSAVDLTSAVLEAGDLLVVRTNGSKDLIGRTAPVLPQPVQTAFASYLIRCRLLTAVVEPAWVALVLSSPHWRQLLERRAASSAGQYNLSISKLSDIPIPLPPLAQQQAILTAFSECLGGVRGQRAALLGQRRTLEALGRSLLNAAAVGELLPQDPADEPAEILLKAIEQAGFATAARRKGRTVRKTRADRAPKSEETTT